MSYSNFIKKYETGEIVTAPELKFLEDEVDWSRYYNTYYNLMFNYKNNYPRWISVDWVEERKIPVKLSPMIKRLLDSESQTLYKAGYLNGDLELTEAGRNALQTILFTQHKSELVKLAQEVLDEAKSK